MLAISLGTTMAVLDGTIANVALPTIARELHASPAASVWVINAFQVTVTAIIVPLAALGDSVGYARVYRAGLAIFTLGSLACALSHSLELLIVARAVQGIGAAGIMSVGPAIYRSIFPSAMLGRAVGYSGLVVAASTAAGPTIGGSILAFAPWPWLFLINVPLGIFDFVFSFRSLPKRSRPMQPFDAVGAALVLPVFALLFIALDGIAHDGSRAVSAIEFAVALAFGVVFVVRSLRESAPLIDLRLFRSARFSFSAAVSFTSFTAQGLAFIGLPFLIQSVMGRSPFESGLLLTTWPVATAFTAPLAGRLTERYDVGILGTVGMSLLTVGLVSLAFLPPDPTSLDILWRGAICGAGFGFYQAPNNHAILSSVPRERSGNASAVISIMRLSGQSTGAALAAIVLATAGATLHVHGVPALREAVTTAFILAAAMTGIGIVASAMRLR
jgi:DHA2 family multidrug resistance protein-like MFS transporter